MAPQLERAGVSVARLGLPASLLSLPRAVAGVTREVRAWSPDRLTTQLPSSDIAGRAAGGRCAIPVLTVWQNTTYHPDALEGRGWRSTAAMSLFQGLDHWTARWAGAFAAVSGEVAESYCAALGVSASRCRVLHNSVDASRFAGDRKPRSGGRGLRLVHVGRHVRQKGLDVLLAALARLPKDAEVVVDQYGAGPLGESLRNEARERGVDARIRWHGLSKDVSGALQAADAFVLPSRHEGLALVYLEALAAGLPVIASDLPANREVDPQGRATLFYPKNDDEALSRAILSLAGNPQRRGELAREARALSEPFRVESVGPKFLALLNSL